MQGGGVAECHSEVISQICGNLSLDCENHCYTFSPISAVPPSTTFITLIVQRLKAKRQKFHLYLNDYFMANLYAATGFLMSCMSKPFTAKIYAVCQGLQAYQQGILDDEGKINSIFILNSHSNPLSQDNKVGGSITDLKYTNRELYLY
jgi:hypothetical protein